MINAKWYKTFNTRVDVTNAISVTQWHKGLLEYVAEEKYNQMFQLYAVMLRRPMLAQIPRNGIWHSLCWRQVQSNMPN
jgi:hypothetical protein